MPLVLGPGEWQEASDLHAERADGLTAEYRRRRGTGGAHAVEDFLYTYYQTRPTVLRRWHPGVDVTLQRAETGPAPHHAWRWYASDANENVTLDKTSYMQDRGDLVKFVRELLAATLSRPPFIACFGLHEWAMVYRQAEHRHLLPLRLGEAETDRVVERHRIRCSHFDAFRFFTPEAAPRNVVTPSRSRQVEMEQPGCLHAAMDCHKWALKLGPVVPGELALDCFELAKEIRGLDMAASPYDLSSYGVAPVAVETAEGKAAYAEQQREFAARSNALRKRLILVCDALAQ